MKDWYGLVPLERERNWKFRLNILRRAERDVAFRRVLWKACKDDVLFFFAAMCFLYEPRPRLLDGKERSKEFPFIPWGHQPEKIRSIREKLGREDIRVEKSRAEGVSWIAVLLALHEWLFYEMSAIGFVSKDLASVDNPDNTDSLFWKFQWELDKLPPWMGGKKDVDWKRTVADHVFRNFRNGSTVTGYTSTGDVASGGRKTWMLLDELSKFPRDKNADFDALTSVQQVTDSRLIVATPRGSSGAYYQVMHEPSNTLKVIFDWKENESKNRGLYRMVGGVPTAIDPENNPLPADYAEKSADMFSRLRAKGFNLEKGERSPWYDRECDRMQATPQNIAQELDRDYGGSDYRIFTFEFFQSTEETVRPPFLRGVLDYDRESLEGTFGKTHDGPWRLWTTLDGKGKPPKHSYVVSADIAAGLAGSHSSNSVCQVMDTTTGEQVLEYATNHTPPSEFADVCIATAKWFHNAFLIWERNGAWGNAYTKRVLENGYGNIHYQKRENVGRGKKKTNSVGWYSTKENRGGLFEQFQQRVRSGQLSLRSKELVDECGQYIVDENGRIVYAGMAKTNDNTSKGEAHGDRVIAMAIAVQAILDRPLLVKAQEEQDRQNPPVGSLAWRERMYEDEDREVRSDWDDRSNYEMATGGLLGV